MSSNPANEGLPQKHHLERDARAEFDVAMDSAQIRLEDALFFIGTDEEMLKEHKTRVETDQNFQLDRAAEHLLGMTKRDARKLAAACHSLTRVVRQYRNIHYPPKDSKS